MHHARFFQIWERGSDRMLLTFGAAELSYRYVETPMRQGALGRWYHDLRSSDGLRRAALAGMVATGAAVGSPPVTPGADDSPVQESPGSIEATRARCRARIGSGDIDCGVYESTPDPASDATDR